jgi:hypothetical protein
MPLISNCGKIHMQKNSMVCFAVIMLMVKMEKNNSRILGNRPFLATPQFSDPVLSIFL